MKNEVPHIRSGDADVIMIHELNHIDKTDGIVLADVTSVGVEDDEPFRVIEDGSGCPDGHRWVLCWVRMPTKEV